MAHHAVWINRHSSYQYDLNESNSKGLYCVVNLDDILIYSRTIEEHLDHLKKIFDILLANKLYAKLNKYEFLQTKVIFLGHILSDKGKEVDPKKAQAIHDWPPPRNIHELRTFLGLANFYYEYIYHYSHIAILLTHVLKKDVKYIWIPMCQAAFKKLKDALTHAPILRFFSLNLPFEVHMDTSTEAHGAVLLQEGKLVAYESKKLNITEKNYSVHELELYAIIHALKT